MEFENSNKLKGYISNESKRLGIHSNDLYTMYFIRKFLEKLYQYDNDNYIIKGSISHLANTQSLTRPFSDIDASSPLNIDDSTYELEKIMNINDDPITYKMVEKFITSRDTACIRILCSFDKLSHRIGFDLRKEESFIFKKGYLPPILKKDNELSIKHAPTEQLIANKMYVILRNAGAYKKDDRKMRRFKDLYDLSNLITTSYDINLVKEFFIDQLNKYGDIDLNKVDLDFLSNDFVKNNQAAFDKEKKIYAFLKDTSFDELTRTSRVVIEDVMRKL